MRYLSVCSGIEAATVAWHGLGWKAAGFAEIEKFPSAVLKERFPDVTNHGDMTKFKEWENVGTVDLLVGGTPCQSFSFAGLRKGLADPRGNLMLTFGAIASHFKARWIVWENVPGVLSSNRGRDFGTFLGMLAECGYGFAYRVLDAQFFGVPQRRRRVFVVGCLGNWLAPAKVLFDSESLSGNPPPSREKGEGFAKGVEIGPGGGHFTEVSAALDAKCKDGPIRNQVGMAVCLMDQGGQIMNVEYEKTGTLRAQMGGHLPIVYDCCGGGDGKTVPTLCTDQPAKVGDYCPIVIDGQGGKGMSNITTENISPTLCSGIAGALSASAGMKQQNYLCDGFILRRLTPVECERLQGFPDDWTRIPYRGKPAESCPDSPRYKACGNSMAVPVMRWIGERINKQEKEENRHED